MQTSPSVPAPTGTTGTTQTSTQVGGTQNSPPPLPNKSTAMAGTQTTPLRELQQDQGTQSQPDHNRENDDDQQAQEEGKGKGKGKKSNKKLSQDLSPCPGMSQSTTTVSRINFISRNLGTCRPTIQCMACGEYMYWRRECLYDNYCTTCINLDNATIMGRAFNRATKNQQSQQSLSICVYCGSVEHSLATCHKRPWDNREQPCGTPDTLRNQQNQPSNTIILETTPGNVTFMGSNTHGHSSQSQSH